MEPNFIPEFEEFLSNFSDNALKSLKSADLIASELKSPYVGTEHILLGVLSQSTSVAAKILSEVGITSNRARMALNMTAPATTGLNAVSGSSQSKGLSETAKLTLKMGWEIAQEFQQDMCGTEHILYSLLSQKNSRATVLMRNMNVDVDKLETGLESLLGRQSMERARVGKSRSKKGKGQSALDFFGTDMTADARQGNLDPVVGREAQIMRAITILNRRTKNNPVLIGEPGVGKTAIVEGLAHKIIKEQVPDSLLDKRIVTIDLAGMLAGTKYRGEFEERLKKVMEELTNDSNTILFIDELHLLVGAGAAEGAIDAANILKPALARGKIQVIGATTTSEYTKHIEKDAALERRFQPIIVPETTKSETLLVLKGLRSKYEDYHGVRIGDDILVDTVNLSDRYLNDRYMPDKAIDLLDEATAHVRVQRGKVNPEEREIIKEMQIVKLKINDSVEDEDYEKAALSKARYKELDNRLLDLRKDQPQEKLKLKPEDLAEVISVWTGVPAKQVAKAEAEALMSLEKRMSKRVIGQSEAVQAISRALRRSRSGISTPNRPIGSFLFMGPTGVGKTELARVLASEFYGNENALIKIDMSEFGERHTVSRLVGAPAGYIGYDESGQLTEKIRRQPYSLVLFDEIEKAHPDVFNMLLQILEDGYLTDAKGRRINFSNTVVIMTSNLGADKLQKEVNLGFNITSDDDKQEVSKLHEQNKSSVMAELKKFMRPELINRLDKVLVFRALSRADISKIVNVQLKDLDKRLLGQKIGIKVSTKAKDWLAKNGYDRKNGVRPLRRLIQDELEDRIAELLLEGKLKTGDIVSVGVVNDKITVKSIKE